MSNDHSQPQIPSDEALIRLAADGELSEELSPALDALRDRDPRTDDRIAHECRLRDAIAGALALESDAPAGLRDRVARAMASVPDAEIEAAEPLSTPETAPAVISTPMGNTRDRAFWTRVPGLLAIAATLALVASVLIVAANASGPLYRDGILGARLVAFMDEQHDTCSEFTDHFEHKFVTRSLEDARALSESYLSTPVGALTLDEETWAESNLEFMGFGPCAVPGATRSGHIMLRSTENPEITVSLFVHADDGRLEFSSNGCCFVSNPASEGDGRVVAWRSEGVVYYLYTPSEEGMRAAREALHTPENELRLL